MMSKTRITSKGQVTIPKDVRDRLLLKESDNLEVKVIDNFIIMEKMKSFGTLKGSLKIPDKYKKKSWKEIESIAQTEHAKEVINE
ncbi:MAG: AbrB/MazE/SpoVT family DNA-binding domain-containing protein [Actinobacteria bacterium]|nr:AbrB/MazE/SpoVT family DNA-binding domain-containing protein [Actinomycetota bacterium]